MNTEKRILLKLVHWWSYQCTTFGFTETFEEALETVAEFIKLFDSDPETLRGVCIDDWGWSEQMFHEVSFIISVTRKTLTSTKS